MNSTLGIVSTGNIMPFLAYRKKIGPAVLINFLYDGMGIIFPVDKMPWVLFVYLDPGSQGGYCCCCCMMYAGIAVPRVIAQSLYPHPLTPPM